MTEKVQDTVEEIKKDEIVETDEVVEKENQEFFEKFPERKGISICTLFRNRKKLYNSLHRQKYFKYH